MSPRSEEFMQQARDRLVDAEAILGTAHPAVVVSAAYYWLGRLAPTALIVLVSAAAATESDAKVLASGLTVSEHPVTVVAIASAYKPSRVVLDVVPHPSAPVRAEWMVLCGDGPGPTTGGSLVTERPAHRPLKLPPRPRGACHLEAEASFVDPDQTGRIAVTLRGRVRKPPFPLPDLRT